MKSCGTCIFIELKNPEDIFCRRYPPTIVVIRDKNKDVVRQFHPSVHPIKDRCGEHKES